MIRSFICSLGTLAGRNSMLAFFLDTCQYPQKNLAEGKCGEHFPSKNQKTTYYVPALASTSLAALRSARCNWTCFRQIQV
jgi:hypothetical protein